MIRPDVLGPLLNRVELHRVEFRDRPDGTRLVAKRRRWWARFALPPGNLYLRWLGAGVKVLSERAWHRREQAVHHALHAIDCPTDSRGWLLLPRWPGQTLADFAADRDRQPAERRAALAAAGSALLGLHQARITTESPPLSHGDATLRNVQYDPATGRAVWFDFDTAHQPRMATEARHADDLRTLLASAVAFAGDLPVVEVVEAVRVSYIDPAPWTCLADWLRQGPIFRSTFHFAQASTPRARQIELTAILHR